jgi:hypothetical protein
VLFRQFQHANGRLSYLLVCRNTRAGLLLDPVPPAVSVYRAALAETRALVNYCIYTGSVPTNPGLEGAVTIRLGPERDTAVGVRVGTAVAVLSIDTFKGTPGPIVPSAVPDIVPSIALLLGRHLVDLWVVRNSTGVRILAQTNGRLFGAELAASGVAAPLSYAFLDPGTIVCPRHRVGQMSISSVAQETGWNTTPEARPLNPDAIIAPLRRAEEDDGDLPTNESVEDMIRRFPPRGPATRRSSIWDP